MIALDGKRLSEADEVLGPASIDKALKARALSRRGQALLAAAGQSEPVTRRWYILTIEQGSDNAVDNTLTNAGVEHWMASVKRTSKWRGGRKWQFCPVVKPAFPGYMFVRVAWGDEVWEGLKAVDGVASVIGGALQPAPLKDKELNSFRARAEKDPKFIAALANALKQGDTVRLEGGLLTGMEGIITALGRAGRVKVEVELFGRPTMMHLDLAQISKVE